ncbi:MAG TPA: hypothetical protein VJB05_00265 [archaeon]|nr:hypothetical protein [archaeon]
MELTISTLTYVLAGVIVFGVSVLVYMYFNGGIQHNFDLMLGLFK